MGVVLNVRSVRGDRASDIGRSGATPINGATVTTGMDLFDSLIVASKKYWLASTATGPYRPPEFIWQRGDLVPIGLLGWDWTWGCLRRDGRVVGVSEVDPDVICASRNNCIGYLMQQIPVASAYLKRGPDAAICPVCNGTGQWREGLCPCGGIGWYDLSASTGENLDE